MQTFSTYLYIVLICCCFNTQLLLGQFDMQQYVNQHTAQSNQDFLRNFPYANYLKVIAFTNFNILQQHRSLLDRQRNLGDDFLYHLGDAFLKQYPVKTSISQLNAKINIGEAYLTPKNNTNLKSNEIYQIIGYFLLGKVARTIEDRIKAGKFDISEPENEKIIKRLASKKVFLTVEKGTLKKLVEAIEKQDYDYIWDRVQKKVKELTGQKNKVKSKLSLHTLNHAKHQYVDIFAVKESGNGKQIGYSIWLQRPHIKMTYVAAGSAYNKYQNFQNRKGRNNVILATTGGFTNVHKQPEGLTVDKGTIVNAVLLPERHGLVIVQDNGGIRVANIKNDFKLPYINRPLSPLNSLIDYSMLINWCKQHKATLFQTQLLAHGDKQLIQVSKAANQLRERRLLVLVTDNKTNVLHNIIFHIEASKNLAVITEEIFDSMKAREKKVEAILNLDVGSYNILTVNDNRGNTVSSVKGQVPISNATNLIIYYK